jgi:hypothetical protein
VQGRTVTRDALETIANTAKVTLQAQAGVSLDNEAAKPPRYQQAFQASGRMMQVAQGHLQFDPGHQVRRHDVISTSTSAFYDKADFGHGAAAQRAETLQAQIEQRRQAATALRRSRAASRLRVLQRRTSAVESIEANAIRANADLNLARLGDCRPSATMSPAPRTLGPRPPTAR